MNWEVGWCISTALGRQYHSMTPFPMGQPKEQKPNPLQELHRLKATRKCNIFSHALVHLCKYFCDCILPLVAQHGCTLHHIYLKACVPRKTTIRKTPPNYLCLNISKLGIAKMWICINARGGRQRTEGKRYFKFSISIGIRFFQCSLRNEDLNSLE